MPTNKPRPGKLEVVSKGFARGVKGALKFWSPLIGFYNPAAGAAAYKASEAIPAFHKGGKARKTGTYKLKKGEVVLSKGQQTQLRKAKTAAGAKRVVSTAKKKKKR